MVFEDLVDLGVVEYLDVNELNDAFIAVYEKDISQETTHLEVSKRGDLLVNPVD